MSSFNFKHCMYVVQQHIVSLTCIPIQIYTALHNIILCAGQQIIAVCARFTNNNMARSYTL